MPEALRSIDLQPDYLVVGAGLAGMAFVDTLLDGDASATAVIVDRRHAPGGHWIDSYPFVRLHLPSHQYGVPSTPLGRGRRWAHGPATGQYESASGAEICGYFDEVMQHRLLASGRVQFLPRQDYLGEGRVRSLVTGKVTQVRARRRIVDSSYQATAVPALSPPPFEVADAARCIAPGELVTEQSMPEGYVIIGAGKTAIDTCLWLLAQGVDPEHIRWIRPRDIWLLGREYYQGGELVDRVVAGVVAQLEAAASSDTTDAYFERCEEAGVMLRIDRSVRPTMVRGATCDAAEVERLRSIEQVVRMGRVQRIEADRIVLDEGSIPTSPKHVHVHCATYGLPMVLPRPIFEPGRITMQFVRQVSPAFSYALIGLVEASARDDDEKNRLLAPNGGVSTPLDWVRTTLQTMCVERPWRREPDIERWKRDTRLNLSKGIERVGETERGAALLARMGAAIAPGLDSMRRMLAGATEAERRLFWPEALQ